MAKRGATANDANPWLDKLMQVFALFMFLGLLTTLLIPETRRKTLEELAGEQNDTPVYELKFVSDFFRAPSSPDNLRRKAKRRSLQGIVAKYFHLHSN